MADNRPTEQMAENRVTSELLKFNIKTSKPYFDEYGTDLLVVDQVSRNSTAILRAQSKGRRYAKGKPSNVTIPIKYVSANFVLFLYVIDDEDKDALLVFFEDDLKQFKINSKQEYYLTVSNNSVANLRSNIMSADIAKKIVHRLKNIEIKKYTTMLVDGIFLEKAIRITKNTYDKIWPQQELKKPLLTEIIHQILYNFNQHPNTVAAIQCQVFLSEDFHLENWTTMPNSPISQLTPDNTNLVITKSDKIISFEILDHLERVINNENILLVADDIIYEPPLNKLKANGTDVILIKLQTDLGGNLYTQHRWGDITRPIALAMGLETHYL